MEHQLTTSSHGHILTNTAVWSPDSRYIVYDTRSDPAGSLFDGTRIEKVDVLTGKVTLLYESQNGACCGVATYHPTKHQVAFILGPENPTPDWSYSATHRQGVIVDESRPGQATPLDARDLVPPFTAGALRGGSHVHVFSGDGQWISFTYQDAILEQFATETDDHDCDLRNVGVSIPAGPVIVPKVHPRNHDGSHFSVLVTQTTARPRPGSDDIRKAFEDAWVGTQGYLRPDGSRQRRALAFQGEVLVDSGEFISELFIADVPDDPTIPGDGPLQGTAARRPFPPRRTMQRRLTRTAGRRFPGLQGPRHWPRSSPDGARIAFLMKDDAGVTQLWTISPNGGEPTQLTRNAWPITSALSWSEDGAGIAHMMDHSVFLTDSRTGEGRRLTRKTEDATTPRPEACVISPNGKRIAFARNVPDGGRSWNQVCVVDVT